MNILEQFKIWILKSRGYKALDGYIPSPLDKNGWVFGGTTNILNQSGDWIQDLPTEEHQKKYSVETMSCISFGSCNAAETLLNFKIKKELISEDNLLWLQDNGYISSGNVNFSDRFIALLSWTTKNGNIASKVMGTIKNYGLIPESMFPWNPEDNTWDKYHDKSKITQAMKNMGYEFKRRFPMEYHIVYRADFEEALKESPIIAFVDGYYKFKNGVLQYSNRMSNHCIMIPKLNHIFDSYAPFLKQIVPNYPYYTGQNFYTRKKYSYGYKIKFNENIIKKKMIEVIKQQNQADYYLVDVEAGTINSFGGWDSYKKFLNAKWCEEVLEVKEKYAYLREKYGKSFVKGSRIGVIK